MRKFVTLCALVCAISIVAATADGQLTQFRGPGAERLLLNKEVQEELKINEEQMAKIKELGMNIGAAAGAGVAGHIHMHVLPRWVADANFMTVVGETRVLPESLEVTWERMRKAFEMPMSD